MKCKLYLFILQLFLCKIIFAQHSNELYNNGALIHIQAGAEVHVLGDIHMRGASATFENNGLLKSDGYLFGDNLFQQRGTGTVRLQNNLANVGESQKISGSFAVRGTNTAAIGVNDGSFYNLEVANGTGIVWLETNAIAGSTAYVADVRNSVNFFSGAVQNRIITHSPSALPTNGSGYSAIFGLLNSTAGLANFVNNTITLNGNSSAVDAGFIQGKLRRVISPAGGTYGFPVGLEPAGAGAKRGVQYMTFTFDANTYGMIESYFETGLTNAMAVQMECTGYSIDYWGGTDHGQWFMANPAGGAGSYSATLWPQDDNFPTKTVWMITKNNSIQGTADQCGSSPVTLTRSGFNGSGSFGVAAGNISILPSELIQIWSESFENYIQVNWLIGSEHNVSHYNLERSDDGINFGLISTLAAFGNSTTQLNYHYDDYAVNRNQLYYYRYKVFDFDGTFDYSPIVQGKLLNNSTSFSTESVYIYPNPSAENLNIGISSLKERDLKIEVYNSIGQIVYSERNTIEKGNTILPIDLNNWASGVYNVKLKDEISEELVWQKFIKL
jgi:hypothetical protein